MFRSFTFRFARNRSGVAAIEFALTVPVLLIALLGVIDLGNVLYQRGDLESALRSGIQYFMNGGDDLAKAKEVVDDSWTQRPEGAVVEAQTFCLCGEVAHACNTLCDDDTYPVSYNRLSVTATFEGILTNDTYASEQTVRVR